MHKIDWKLVITFIISAFLMSVLFAVFVFNKNNSLGKDLSWLSLGLALLINISIALELLFVLQHFFGRKVAVVSSLLCLINPWMAYVSLIDFKMVAILFAVLSFLLVSLVRTKFKYFLYIPIFVFVVKFDLTNYLVVAAPFGDIRHLNSVNEFQGILARGGCQFCNLIENRYLYFIKLMFINFVDAFSPVIYFFPQVPFLGKSFVPPVYSVLLAPFLIGVAGFIKRDAKRFFLLLLIFLIGSIPSSLTATSPNISKLFLISPLIFVFIGNGVVELTSKGHKNYLSYVVLLGVFVQYLFTLFDVWFMEGARL